MEIERTHRTTTTTTTPTTSELLICFTSRLSHSSSMRISSKSILSPARPTGSNPTNHSLTTSLSRRLRHSGSLRGSAGSGSTLVGQSPSMLVNKKSRGGGGSGFDNPEPSSPKVTCIGQVRVKTKKQGKKMKMRACRSKSRRLSGGSEASFRRFDGGGLTPQNSLGGSNTNQDRNLRNQRWVHLPVTICDAIRAFGNEFSCLIPCKSSCFSSSNEGGSNGCDGDERRDGYGACGAVCSWLVAMHDGEEEDRGRRRDIELVVGDGGEERVECSRRRSIFDDMEFKDEVFDVKNGGEVSGGGRVSICAPPKNALLLMRCRSDPMKVSALSQKIWEAPVVDFDSEDEEEKEEEGEDDKVIDNKVEDCEDVKEVCVESEKCGEVDEICEDVCVEVDKEDGDECEMEGFGLDIFNEEVETEELMEEGEDKQCEECEEKGVVLGEDKVENGDGEESEVDLVKEEEEEISEESNQLSCISSVTSVEESTAESVQENDQVNEHESGQELVKSVYEDQEEEEEEETPLEGQSHQDMTHQEGQNKSKWEVQKQEKGEEIKRPVLPDCLLLMMCEPKLSMEVSKETWVCSTDFIRWLPERHHNKKSTKIDGSDEPKKKKSGGLAPVQPVKPVVQVQGPVQPGRSSISFPTGGGPVGKMVEPKLVKPGASGGGIEPFVLTRCKSAPMRSAGKNGPPELPCSLWRRESSRKIEPHRASFGATGVGF